MIRRRSRAQVIGNVEPEADESDPRLSLMNLADVMLVLAVALMLALVTHWGVDMSSSRQIDTEALKPTDADLSSADTTSDGASSGYEEVGTVYRDRQTGELYVLGQ